MKRKWIWIIISILLISVLAWSPWLNVNKAAAKIQAHLEKDIGNCVFYPQIIYSSSGKECAGNCYSISPQRIPFGYIDRIKINCNSDMNPLYDKETTYYLSPFGSVHKLS